VNGKQPRILLIESDKVLLEKLIQILNAANYQVLATSDLEKAYELFAKYLHDLALVITDLATGQTPQQVLEMIGFFRQNMLDNFPSFGGNVLVTADQPRLSLAKDFEELNIIGCLLKPFTPEAILEAVKASLSLEPDDFTLATGERVYYLWERDTMTRMLIGDGEGQVYKTGSMRRGGLLSVCIPVVTGYCPNRCQFCTHTYSAPGSTRKRSVPEIVQSVKATLAGNLFQPQLQPGEKFDLAFTGEGEPAHNLDNVLAAITELIKEYGSQIRRIVLSTVSRKTIEKLLKANFSLPIQLQISTTFLAEDREKYMPGATALPELLELAYEYYLKIGSQLPVILNYILIKDKSDRLEQFKAFKHLILDKRHNQPNCFVVKISNYSPIQESNWLPSEGKAMQFKALLAAKKIPSFFWRLPRREFQRISEA